MAIEAIPSVYDKLVKNRQCITVNGCVAPKNGKDRFRVINGYSQMLSGLVSEYDETHRERIERELGSHGGDYEDIEVNCYNINELLESDGILQVDYLSIDVEGAAFKILDSIVLTEFSYHLSVLKTIIRTLEFQVFRQKKVFLFIQLSETSFTKIPAVYGYKIKHRHRQA